MKTILSLILSLTCFYSSFAQNIERCLNIKVETIEACETAEDCIKKLSDFVLKSPFKEKGEKVDLASKKVVDWMNITMNYGFTINEHIMPVLEGENRLLFRHYMVSLAKGAFIDPKHQDYEGLKIFVQYIGTTKNGVTKSKAVKNLLKDWHTGNIEKYIIRGVLPEK
jgi:hypothetical protein